METSTGGKIFIHDQKSFVIGLILAILSSIFIGSSFIIKKSGLKRLSSHGYLRAGAGGFRYLKEWIWWLGLLMMGLGEALNFVAYAFAPASLVTPLGALSVLVAAVLSSKFLNERLNFLGKLGCFLCVVGSTIIVIHSPKPEEINSVAEMEVKLQEPVFLIYLSLILIIALVVSCYAGPRYGNQNILVYLLLCSAVGSLTVVFCKGIGISIKEAVTRSDADGLQSKVFWILLLATVVCIMVQMNYLNKSLDVFNTSLVTPVYYVMFTTLVLVASSILFQEWKNMTFVDSLGNVCGFMTVIVGIVLLNAFKDMNVSFRDIYSNAKPKRESMGIENNNGGSETGHIIDISYGNLRNGRC